MSLVIRIATPNTVQAPISNKYTSPLCTAYRHQPQICTSSLSYICNTLGHLIYRPNPFKPYPLLLPRSSDLPSKFCNCASAYLWTCPSPTLPPPTNEPCWLVHTPCYSSSPHTAHTSWSLTTSTPSAKHCVSGRYSTSNTVQAPTSASNLSST